MRWHEKKKRHITRISGQTDYNERKWAGLSICFVCVCVCAATLSELWPFWGVLWSGFRFFFGPSFSMPHFRAVSSFFFYFSPLISGWEEANMQMVYWFFFSSPIHTLAQPKGVVYIYTKGVSEKCRRRSSPPILLPLDHLLFMLPFLLLLLFSLCIVLFFSF